MSDTTCTLSVNLAPDNARGLVLKNPVMTASGTFGYGMDYDLPYAVNELGAVVCKGTTLKPRTGNIQPRIAETPSGMLNAIGLQNIGVERLIQEKAPVWETWQVPVIVNIAGETVEEYGVIARLLDSVPGVAGIEVNISCPNVSAGGAEFGTSPESAARVTKEVRRNTGLPVIVKLTPNVTDICAIARAVVDAGADALCVINTLKGMSIDIKQKKPLLGNVTGGLSGPAVKPVAIRMVYEVAGVVAVPVIGCGGITTAEDALEFIMAGATAVEIGTANLVNPLAPQQVIAGMRKYLEMQEIADINTLRGIARLV